MSANRSSAVMQQRRTVAPGALDYFPTPPWATRALCEFLITERSLPLDDLMCWEPACGELHMARPLSEYFADVVASDVHRYTDDHEIYDFALASMGRDRECPDFVITNPPFQLAVEFIAAASRTAKQGFAMLVRSAFLEGSARYRDLWASNPPSFVLQFTERVVMLEGRLIRAGDVDPFSQKPRTKASTATAYVWLVWLDGEADTRLRWIPPCRDRLERSGDYPDYPAIATEAPLLDAVA